MDLSPGFRFAPTEEELVLSYLLKKVRGEALPCDVIKDREIYGEHDKEPWKIFDENLMEKFYVFTKLKKKNGRGKRIERKAGRGTWKGQRTDFVKDSNDNHIGFNKLFVFEVKDSGSSNAATNGHWLMHEYSLVNDQSDYVLSEIRNKNATGPVEVPEEDGRYEWTVEDIDMLMRSSDQAEEVQTFGYQHETITPEGEVRPTNKLFK